MTNLPKHVLGVEARGTISAEEYHLLVETAVERRLRKGKAIHLLCVIPSDANLSGGAVWEDLRIDAKHPTAFHRVAVVTDDERVRAMVRAAGVAMSGETRSYAEDDLASAVEWISEPPSSGRLSSYLDRKHGVLLLEPHGKVEAGDFSRLSEEVAPYVESHGALKGVAIVAEQFPGWSDLHAFTSHINFVNEHRDKIQRLALVTNDHMALSVPRIASLFTKAEVRTFDMNEVETAVSWLSAA